MAAGAGHEMNNPLAIISGRAQLLQGKIGDSDNAKAVETIVEQAHRCSQIVNELMSFAKPPPPAPDASHCRRFWARRCGSGRKERAFLTQAHADLPQELPDVHFDREHLAAILQEILDNSLQALARIPPVCV